MSPTSRRGPSGNGAGSTRSTASTRSPGGSRATRRPSTSPRCARPADRGGRRSTPVAGRTCGSVGGGDGGEGASAVESGEALVARGGADQDVLVGEVGAQVRVVVEHPRQGEPAGDPD